MPQITIKKWAKKAENISDIDESNGSHADIKAMKKEIIKLEQRNNYLESKFLLMINF